MRAKHNASQRECELLRSELAKQQDTEKTFWQPLRMQWLAGQEEVQELQESYQAVCNALAQAEARLSELDQSTISDPVKASTEKTTTSLLGELDMARHRAVSEQQELYKEHSQLKRAYVRTLGAQSRMKQQVARLSQLAASGASEARMRRLEAALGEAECQRQAMAWASMASPQPQQQLADDSLDVPADSTVLVATLRTKLRRVAADRDQALRELRTAHLLRANEIQRTRELEREVADTENRLRRAGADIAALRTQFETLKRSTRNSKKPSHDSLPGDSPIASMRIMPPNSKPRVAEKAPPPRKRTPTKIPATGGSDISAEDAKKPGPMSLAFVINSESNGGPPKDSMSDTTLQNQMEPVNRKRSASGSPAGAQSPKVFGSRPSDYTALSLATSTVETETSVGTSSSFLDMRTLAGRGMRSCCQSLASAVKSVGLCSSKPKVTTTGPPGSASSNPSPTSPPVKRPRKKGEASVEEIFTFTHANTQKPSECTNQ
ncbi:hypothetical protein FBU59_004010 [Linderina macrospora]|uniref:Uncharacterized protein n=1 Tax=Linderina macrospora TaxID=4868 RepID=A0ACC1J717_9FUNG|nr:hypothetical protein FBU59_004010 [Linderina macrospora]